MNNLFLKKSILICLIFLVSATSIKFITSPVVTIHPNPISYSKLLSIFNERKSKMLYNKLISFGFQFKNAKCSRSYWNLFSRQINMKYEPFTEFISISGPMYSNEDSTRFIEYKTRTNLIKYFTEELVSHKFRRDRENSRIESYRSTFFSPINKPQNVLFVGNGLQIEMNYFQMNDSFELNLQKIN